MGITLYSSLDVSNRDLGGTGGGSDVARVNEPSLLCMESLLLLLVIEGERE